MAYLYNYTNNPWKAQPVIKKLVDEMYTNKPDGLAGNEDCGQMSAWYVLSAMGFYPVNPCGGIYDLGYPAFKSVKISLPLGKTFTINADRKSADAIYPASLKMNGKAYNNNFINHKDLFGGGTFKFTLTNNPDKDFSAGLKAPVSAITEYVTTPLPHIVPAKRRFAQPMTIELKNPDKNAVIYYTLDGTEPTVKSFKYEQPITIPASTTLKAFAVSKGELTSKVITAEFEKASLLPAVNVDKQLNPGLKYAAFEGKWPRIPDFTKLTPVKSGIQQTVSLENKSREEYFAMDFSGYIYIPEDGMYTFTIGSDDGSILIIDGKDKIDNDGMHSFGKKDRDMLLAKGYHTIKISYVQGGGDCDLKLFWKGAKGTVEQVPANVLFN